MSAIRHAMTVLVLGMALAGCEEDAGQTAAAASDVPALLSPQRAACERSGGQWGRVPGRDAFVCYSQTRDANKRCETARDCEGLCLARSRTCAPQVPFFGCHEILAANGARQTLCTE
jgi:hypothetical protein